MTVEKLIALVFETLDHKIQCTEKLIKDHLEIDGHSYFFFSMRSYFL